MERWQQSGPASYDLDVELRGAQPGEVHVEVRQREVEKKRVTVERPDVHGKPGGLFPGLFDTLSQDLQIA